MCRAEALSLPAATFPHLLLAVAVLLLGLLSLPIYWGAPGTRWRHHQPPVSPSQLSARELFNNFHYIWAKLRSGEEECKDVEWKRRTQFVLEQLRTGDTLTRRWAAQHC